jgi:hypothetical protein
MNSILQWNSGCLADTSPCTFLYEELNRCAVVTSGQRFLFSIGLS